MAATSGDNDPVAGLSELAKAAQAAARSVSQQSGPVHVIAFFDLSGSTQAKLLRGNAPASQDALTFTNLAAAVSSHFGGQVLKTMGDGALAIFDDPVGACRAALNLRYATHELLKLRMTAGLTSGRPIHLSLTGDSSDVLGDVVDRAARVQSLALPGQVLVDGTLYNQLRAEIAGQRDWSVDQTPRRAYAKGVGELELYELCLPAHWRLKAQLATPFNIIPSGRPSIPEKLALIRNAKQEIIEIGIGLTSFGKYFTGQKPEEFRDPIRVLVRGGVNVRCFALDLDHDPGVSWLGEQGNKNYTTEARIAREALEEEARVYRYEEYLGEMGYYTYRRVPEFWCLGVDIDDPVDGRMFFAPYLMDVERASTPVMQLSRTSHPELYTKYLQSIHAVRAASDEAGR